MWNPFVLKAGRHVIEGLEEFDLRQALSFKWNSSNKPISDYKWSFDYEAERAWKVVFVCLILKVLYSFIYNNIFWNEINFPKVKRKEPTNKFSEKNSFEG